jgi:hypothetical protein
VGLKSPPPVHGRIELGRRFAARLFHRDATLSGEFPDTALM